jgi:hypothetical protein
MPIHLFFKKFIQTSLVWLCVVFFLAMRLASAQIANHSLSEANSLGLSGSASMGGSAAAKADAAKSGQAQAVAPTGPGGMKLMDASATNNTAAPSAMAVSSNDSSVTQSGISGGTITVGQQSAQGLNSLNGLNRKVVSGTDSSGKIANNFNQADLQTTLTVASAFIQQAAPFAAKLVGDIGESKQKAANKEADLNLSFVKQAIDNGNAEDAAHYQNLADQARANAASWGDNGSNRIALHAASQALIGGLSGGSTGALNSGSGALAGNLGQQLGASMAATEAKRLGLDETAAKSLANSYQQSLATIGGALGGLIAGSASGQNGTGSLVAAAQAGNTAMAVDVYNRQLHQKEIDLAKKYAKQVAKAGHITEEEAAARIERQILRWTNADTNKFDGGKVDELVLSQIGISGKDAALGIAWDYKNFATKNSAEYNNSSINQQNVVSYSPLITQVNLGKTPAQYEQQAHDGKVTALTAALCSVTLGGCAFMSGFNIGEGGTKIANGDTLGGSLQVGGGVLGLGGTIYAASKASIQTAAQVNAQGGTNGTGALITLGANTEKELAALTGLNGTGVYAPKTTGTSGGYSGLTVLDGNGKVIPNATLPSVGTKVGTNRSLSELILERPTSNQWGNLENGTNQGAKHFADYWEKFPERIPSIETRLGLEAGTFGKSPEGFDAFTNAAKSVVMNGEVRNLGNGKSIYFVEGAESARKGVVVIVKDGKFQTMMPSDPKTFKKME